MREGKAMKTETKPQNAWVQENERGEKGNLMLLNI